MIKVLGGADPEMFIRVDNKIIPAVGIFPGTKDAPFKVENSPIGLTLQEDNVTLELGWDPVDKNDFQQQARLAYRQAAVEVSNRVKGGAIYCRSYHEFQPEDLASEQAQVFGCSPDMLAHFKGAVRPPVEPAKLKNHRCAGGHIHVGYDRSATPIPDWAIVQFMDLAYMFDIEAGRDRQGIRRQYYGLAGLYRRKTYGLEYRTPGNYWFVDYPSQPYSMLAIAEAAINKPNFARTLHRTIPWAKVVKSIADEESCIAEDNLRNWYHSLLDAPNEIGDTEESDVEQQEAIEG